MPGMPHARERAPKAAKELDHLKVRQAENGGHVVEHHFTNYEHQPEQHVFGDGEGEKMLAHVGKHMGVKSEYSEDGGGGDGYEE